MKLVGNPVNMLCILVLVSSMFTINMVINSQTILQDRNPQISENSLKIQTPSPPPTKKSTLMGTGDNKSLILRSSNQSTVNLLLNQTNSTFTTEIPTGWDVISTNLTVSNIQAYNQSINVENSPDSGSFPLSGNERVTSFEVISKCYLENVSVRLYETSGTPSWILLSLYNATWDGTRVKPNTATYTFLLSETVDGINGWYTFSGLHHELDPDSSFTDNNTYFISLSKTAAGDAEWLFTRDDTGAAGDNLDETQSYHYDTDWSLSTSSGNTIDYQLIVDVAPPSSTPTPSQINMKINGSSISDNGTNNSGFFGSNERYFSRTLNWNFSVDWYKITSVGSWEHIYEKKNGNVTSHFSLNANAAYAKWNFTSSDATNFGPENSIKTPIIMFNISNVYKIVEVYNSSGDVWDVWDSHMNCLWTNHSENDYIIVEIYNNSTDSAAFAALNNTYFRVETYLANIINYTGVEINGAKVTSEVVSNETLKIYFNTSMPIVCSTASKGIIAIYNSDNALVNVMYNTTAKTDHITFNKWDIDADLEVTGNGIYTVQASWSNGTYVGFASRTFPLINTSAVQLITTLPKKHVIGVPFEGSIYYNSTFGITSYPVTGASVSVNLHNDSLPDSGWFAATVNGDHYDFSVPTAGLNSGIYGVQVNATKSGLLSWNSIILGYIRYIIFEEKYIP